MPRKVVKPVVKYQLSPDAPADAVDEVFDYLLDMFFAQQT
jgi:hypothetical protein